MNIKHMVGRGLGASALVAGAALLPFAAGLARVAPVGAEGPVFPLYSTTTAAEIGVVEMDGAGSVAQLVVTLDGATPNTTYTVAACEFGADGVTLACSSSTADATNPTATVTTDATGSAEKLVTFDNLPASSVVAVTVTSTANAGDNAMAATGANVSVPAGAVPPVSPS